MFVEDEGQGEKMVKAAKDNSKLLAERKGSFFKYIWSIKYYSILTSELINSKFFSLYFFPKKS